MTEINVNFNALLQGQAGIAQTYSRLTSTLEELEGRLAPMLQTWSGSAQESYLQCKKQWDESAAALATVLNSIGSAVGDAHQNYQAAENSAKGNWE
ncbi:MAG TPA: WXG100 family type VII secretion target [Jatrophihabitantaceae bacterium]|jgi:WXG100 family type VII secretion target